MLAKTYRHSLLIMGYCCAVSWMAGCKDFSQFDCFQLESGCSPVSGGQEDIEQAMDASSLERSDITPDSPPQDQLLEDRPRDMEVDDVGVIDMAFGPRDSVVDMSPDAEVDAAPPLDLLERCQENLVLDLNRPNSTTARIHWHCLIEEGSEQPFQVMIAEMSTRQASFTWRYLMALCNSDNSSSLALTLCENLDQFKSDDYQDELRDEWRLRFQYTPTSNEDKNLVKHTPIVELSPAEIINFINTLNTWAEQTSHPYRYELPTFSLWRRLYQAINGDDYECAPTIRGVYQGSHEFDDNTGDGCNFDRPRTVTVNERVTLCHDRIWSRRPMGDPITESRSLSAELPLCDIHGNMREVLQDCPDSDFCSQGGGWKSSHSDHEIISLDPNNTDDDLSFRLIRRRAP